MRYLSLILAGLLSPALLAPAALAQQTPPQPAPATAETPADTIPEDAGQTETADEDSPPEAEPVVETPPEPAVPVSVRDNTLLKKEKTFEAIQLGDEASLIALYQPSAQEETRGLLVILHPAVAPAGLPTTLESLRRHLPASGWASLAFAIPDQLPPAPPAGDPRPQPAPVSEAGDTETADDGETASEEETTEATTPPAAETNQDAAAEEANSEGAEAETPAETAADSSAEAPAAAEEEPIISPEEARAETLQLRLAALTSWLQQQEGIAPILVIENHHASEILPLLNQQLMMQQQTLRALVLLNTSQADNRSPDERDAFFRDYTWPVLDVFLQPETSRTREIRRWQQASAKRQKHPAYRQLLLAAPAFTELDEERHYWVERVRGFLTRLPAANGNGQAQ